MKTRPPSGLVGPRASPGTVRNSDLIYVLGRGALLERRQPPAAAPRPWRKRLVPTFFQGLRAMKGDIS